VKRTVATFSCALAAALATAGCTVEINHAPAPRAEKSATATVTETPVGGSGLDCASSDCAHDRPTLTTEVVCSPLPAAATVFDGLVNALPEIAQGRSGPTDRTITDVVIDIVERCGYQVMADIAFQYPEPISTGLMRAAASALGEIGSLPMGLRCAELKALGLGPKQAVDYWFASGAPALMDADLNGIPCETVWTDVARYIPLYY
jgi:hypothetical protein